MSEIKLEIVEGIGKKTKKPWKAARLSTDDGWYALVFLRQIKKTSEDK